MSEIDPDALSVDISKNSTETIRIHAKEYRGCNVIDVRIWVAGNKVGELIPTRQGVCFRCELLPDIIESLQTLAETVPVEWLSANPES